MLGWNEKYYVRMKKGKKEIYGEAYGKDLILEYIKQQEACGFKVVEKNFKLFKDSN